MEFSFAGSSDVNIFFLRYSDTHIFAVPSRMPLFPPDVTAISLSDFSFFSFTTNSTVPKEFD
jgi:hypothetical protein